MNVKRLMTTIAVGVFVAVASVIPAATLVQPVSAAKASSGGCASSGFLGFPAWYRGLTNADCSMKSPNDVKGGEGSPGLGVYIWTIALNIIQMVIVLIAYIAAFYIIYGGFQFVVGGSNAATVEKARKTIQNAIIGLIIALVAIALVNYAFSIISG